MSPGLVLFIVLIGLIWRVRFRLVVLMAVLVVILVRRARPHVEKQKVYQHQLVGLLS